MHILNYIFKEIISYLSFVLYFVNGANKIGLGLHKIVDFLFVQVFLFLLGGDASGDARRNIIRRGLRRQRSTNNRGCQAHVEDKRSAAQGDL